VKLRVILTTLALLFSFLACSEKESNINTVKQNLFEKHTGPFSLVTKIRKLDQSQIDSLYQLYEDNFLDSVFVWTNFKGKKYLRIDGFEDSFEAGEVAFNLINELKISKFNCLHNEKIVRNKFYQFPFIGNYLNRPALYYFDLYKLKPELVWGRWGKKILASDFSQRRDKAFFLTSLTYGQQGNFPYYQDGRIYKFQKKNDSVRLLRKFGDGNSLSLFKDNIDSMYVFETKIDSINSLEFVRKKYFISENNKIINSSLDRYNILEDGFPGKITESIILNSPSKKMKIEVRKTKKNFMIHLLNRVNKKDYLLYNQNTLPEKILWDENEKIVVILDEEVNTNDSLSTSLYICKTENGILEDIITVKSKSEAIIYGNLLIYDEGMGDSSKINFYDYKKEKQFFQLKMSGGCGINKIRYN